MNKAWKKKHMQRLSAMTNSLDFLRRLNFNTALKMLAIKKGSYKKFMELSSRFTTEFERREFMNVMIPILKANYDTVNCPPPEGNRRLWPDHIEGSMPLLCQTEPAPAKWLKNEL